MTLDNEQVKKAEDGSQRPFTTSLYRVADVVVDLRLE